MRYSPATVVNLVVMTGSLATLQVVPHGDHNFATTDGTTEQNQATVIDGSRRWWKQVLATRFGRR